MLSPTRRAISVTIAASGSLSAAVDLEGGVPAAVQIPAAWTAAGLTFQVSPDNSTFGNVYDTSGTEVTITSAAIVASRVVAFPEALRELFRGGRYMKVRSGTSGTPVNQAAARVLKLLCRQT